MAHATTVIAELLEAKKMKPVEASKRSGIPQPQWSRWRSTSFISDEHLHKLCATIFTTKEEQAALISARMLDARPTDIPGSKLIEVIVHGKAHKLQDESPAFKASLPPQLKADLDTLAEHIATDKLLADIVHSLASNARKKSA